MNILNSVGPKIDDILGLVSRFGLYHVAVV